MLQQLLDGTFGLLDYLIVPHNRNSIQAIFRELRDARRFHGGLPQFETYYLDKAWSSSFVSEAYNRDAIIRLRQQLESWAGKPIEDATLLEWIAIGDRNRELLRGVADLRAANPPRLSGADALEIIGSSMFMDKREHNRLLEAFLATAGELPARDGVRLFLGGSPLDHTRVYQAIEACGATIVAEDHCWGNRVADSYGEGPADPILELGRRFHRKPACSITLPLKATVQGCARRAAAASADAAIFYVMEDDWSQNWETPGEVKALGAAGVPALHLARQAYDGGDIEALKAAVSRFLQSVPSQRAAIAAREDA
jgi:benzoyl-CoA reductase/2-hydroxyglutaryl-CoA dehydratase subunit BcrC/BadD/HgdB